MAWRSEDRRDEDRRDGDRGIGQYLSNKKNSSIMRGRKGGGEDKEAIQVA
jgi:hypothetical protein